MTTDGSRSIAVDALASLVHTSGCDALRRVAQTLTRHYDDHLEPLGMRATELAALRVCAATGPLTISGFSRELDATPSMVRRTLKPLLERALLAPVSFPRQRPRKYELTAEGKEALLAGIEQWDAAQSRLIDALGQDGWQRVNQQLSVLCDI